MLRLYNHPLLILCIFFTLWGSCGCKSAYTETNTNSTLTIVAVGDIMMGTIYPVDILPPDDGKGIFKAIQGEFKDGDIVFGNLEGSLCDEGKPVKCKVPLSKNCFEFVMPTRYAGHLKEAGFSVLNIANNHILDAGFEGAENTITTLRNAAGIQVTGGERIANLARHGKRLPFPDFLTRLLPMRVPFWIFQGRKVISRLKKDHDIVIVSFHGGAEGKHALHIPKGDETFLEENRECDQICPRCHRCRCGHGYRPRASCAQAMEVYKGKLIAYSLGNFLTYALFNLKGPNSLSVILRVRIDAQKRPAVFSDEALVPVHLVNRGFLSLIPPVNQSGLSKSSPPARYQTTINCNRRQRRYPSLRR